MIGVSISMAVFIYFAVWLAIVVMLWIREVFRVRRNKWQLNNNRLFNCKSCHYTFLTEDAANLTRCPRCNAICIRHKHDL